MSLAATLVAHRGAFTLDIGLSAPVGSTLALVGPNGSGKSTTLGCLAGTVPLDAGTITVGGRVLDDAHTHVEVEKRRVGVVFQDYLLFPHLSALENVAFGPRSVGVARRDARERASAWLDRLGVGSLALQRPGQLSGGQAQRVALARALASEPDLLLLDEPLAALDVEVRDEVRESLAAFLAEYEGTTIVITHSLADVTALADSVAVIEGGRITQSGAVASLLETPATPYARRLVA